MFRLALRYIFLFSAPIALNAALYFVTYGDSVAQFRHAADALPDLVARNPVRARAALEIMREGLTDAARWRLAWLPRLTVLLALTGAAAIIPRHSPPRRVVNMLTATCLGLGFARLVGGFPLMPWDELALCLLIGLGLAIGAIWLRDRFAED